MGALLKSQRTLTSLYITTRMHCQTAPTIFTLTRAYRQHTLDRIASKGFGAPVSIKPRTTLWGGSALSSTASSMNSRQWTWTADAGPIGSNPEYVRKVNVSVAMYYTAVPVPA